MTGDRQLSMRNRLLAFVVASLGGAAAILVSFAVSVYEAAHPEPLRTLAAGEPVDTGRWLLSVHDARIEDTPPTGRAPEEPKRFLTVGFELDNRSAGTSAVPNLLLPDPPVEGLSEPQVYLARDRQLAGGLHPDMPERLIAVWEWPQAQPLPLTIRLLIGSQIYKRRDNLYGASNWLDREPVAMVELPVAGRAGAPAR